MKTDFINNMTHEFKTPIASIALAAEALQDPSIQSEQNRTKRFLKVIEDENLRLKNHVDKVLQTAIIDKGELKLNITDIDIHAIIEIATKNAGLQVEKRGGRIRSKLNASDPIIMADKGHITNVIYNLLDNANKYSPENPAIEVETYNIGDGVNITVKDNGIGMTKETQKKIFDKFYRINTGNLHDVKGFGLGLNYVRAIVQLHGGNISIESEPGKGSSFSIFIPFKNDK